MCKICGFKGAPGLYICSRYITKGTPILRTCYTETLFAESKFNVLFCLGICFCVKVHFTLQDV